MEAVPSAHGVPYCNTKHQNKKFENKLFHNNL